MTPFFQNVIHGCYFGDFCSPLQKYAVGILSRRSVPSKKRRQYSKYANATNPVKNAHDPIITINGPVLGSPKGLYLFYYETRNC